MRKLATIRKVLELVPIDGADFIELAVIGGWQCVVKKGEFSVGDLCVYFEIDSMLPRAPWNEFLFIDPVSTTVRLKTKKFKGQISQGLLVPLSVFPDLPADTYDLTNFLKIEKYESTALLGEGNARGTFPNFIPKTDEERIQNLDFSKTLNHMKENEHYATEKLDGTSITIFVNEGEFGVCSRNNLLKEDFQSKYYKPVVDLDIEKNLRSLNTNIALQGELLGPNIQGNKYQLTDYRIYFFNMFDIVNQKHLHYDELAALCKKFNLNIVPLVDLPNPLPEDYKDFLKMAEGKSVLNSKTEREGLVIRHINSRSKYSFKIISNKFILKNDE